MQSATFQTKVPEALHPFLDALAPELAQVERFLNTRLEQDKEFGQLEKEFQITYRLDSQSVRNVHDNLKGKRESRKQCLDREISELEDRITELKKSIKKYIRSLKTAKKKAKIGEKQAEKQASNLRFLLHQKKRKLYRLESKLVKKQQIKSAYRSPIIFGGKELFKAQFNLEANGYLSHDQWLNDWRNHRNYNILMVGSKRFEGGNQLCRLDTSGRIKITVPPCLQSQFGTHVEAEGVKFRYGWEYIKAALQPKRYESTSNKTGKISTRIGTEEPVTHRFIKRDQVWYLHTTVNLPAVPYQSYRRNGMLAVDLNPTSIDWAYCDIEGNLKASGTLRINIQDKSTEQTQDALGKACAELVRLAESFGCPITIEKLDFSKKKAKLGDESPRYARMLSNFAYSKFYQVLASRCAKFGVELIRVNPAYSSLQGLTKYMAMYGMTSGTAAALVLARRALRLSERLPRALHNALKKPVDSFRHVWGAWSLVVRVLDTCGSRNRHLFYTQKDREANSLLEVNPIGLRGDGEGSATSKTG